MVDSILTLTEPKRAVLMRALVKFIMDNPSVVEHVQSLDLFGDELVLNAEQADIVGAALEGYQGAAQMMIEEVLGQKIDLQEMLALLPAKTLDPSV